MVRATATWTQDRIARKLGYDLKGHRLELFAKAGSLGGVESLVSMPARMSHRRLSEEERNRVGVPSSLLRLSVGLESPADLVADLERALG